MHDLGMRFNTPFVNLWISPADFILYCSSINNYIDKELQFIKSEYQYPVAVLDNITLYFAHYNSQEEAEKKWRQRTLRINLSNLFIVMLQSNGWEYQNLVDFEKLNIKNKVCLTFQEYPEFKSAFHINGFESKHDVGTCGYFLSPFSIKKHYDTFPWVEWFNGSDINCSK